MSHSVLSISNLSFAYPATAGSDTRQSVLKDLSLNVESSELVCILGASGCGKTTLLNLIAGLADPDGGTISIKSAFSAAGAHSRIGYIFQQDALLPWRMVRGNLGLAAEINKELSASFNSETLKSYLAAFNLNEDVLDKFPAQLSGGMRQRVSIIQSLMLNPELILLDEPFAALDFYTKLRLESEFRQLIKTADKGAVLVTHDIDEAIAMGDRILIMDKGGTFTREFVVELGDEVNSPEEARGSSRFAEYYHQIWSDLKAVISQ